jgi:FkbH-like protein
MIKCVIWDLDDTLWRGVLPDGDDVTLDPDAAALVRALDDLGIVQSISSKNDHDPAMRKLEEFEIAQYFVYPEITWGAKSRGVSRTVESLNISFDSVALIDDSPFERAEVAEGAPGIRSFSLGQFRESAELEAIQGAIVTDDARRRPASYRAEAGRRELESSFVGTPVEFLQSLGLRLTIRRATEVDLDRASELTMRTSQLNTTGKTFTSDELRLRLNDDNSIVVIAELVDKFGDYGRIGLALLDVQDASWTIELILMSCRVGGRNIGNGFIAVIANQAATEGRQLRAQFRSTSRNRQMLITYKMLGFVPVSTSEGVALFEHPDPASLVVPPYLHAEFDLSSAARRSEKK